MKPSHKIFDATKIIVPSDYTFLIRIFLEVLNLCIKKTSFISLRLISKNVTDLKKCAMEVNAFRLLF